MSRRKPGRSKLRMYLDVLEAVYREGGRARFTKVLSESGIPYDRFLRYQEELESRGLLAEFRDGDARYVELTAEGLRFLEELRRMERFLRDLGLEL
ncbi:MAG: winged helix-turn-helix domain-containing protein [Conexivisphaera sp.]